MSGDWHRVERVVAARAAAPARAGVALVPLAVVLVALVAAASSHLLDRVRVRTPGLSVGAVLGDALIAVTALTAVGFAFAAREAWRTRGQKREARERAAARGGLERRDVKELSLAALVLLGLMAWSLAVGLLVGRPDVGGAPPAGPRNAPGGGAAGGATASPVAARESLPVHWLVLAVLGGVATVAALVLLLRARRRRAPAAAAAPADELLAAVDESLDDLAREPDPRRAVIRAYARMERALEGQGAGRRPAETQLEHLARALAAVRASQGSIRRLSALFARAKYSPHPIDTGMKADAIAALSELRDEVQPG